MTEYLFENFMITKSIIYLAIIFRLLSLNTLADRFDNAIYKTESDNNIKANAASYSLPLPFVNKTPEVDKFVERPNILAKHYILVDMDSNTVILKNGNKDRVPIASTTKIMTAVVALENYELNDIVTVSAAAANQAGSDANLRIGEKITVKELLYCLLVKSSNDSAYALAENLNTQGLSGGVDAFVQQMNLKAKKLGMKDTNYQDPAGLDVTGTSSASDLYIVTKYAMQNATFRQMVVTKDYVAKSFDGQTYHQLENSNRLVKGYDYMGAIGVKTGYMPEAGHCLVSAVKRDGHTLIGVVLNTYADTATASADESKKMMDWGWENIRW